MLFRQIFEPVSCTYTYLLASDYGREGLIIDPVLDHLEAYVRLIQELGLKLVLTMDTHIHADHVTASGHLVQALNCRYAIGSQARIDFDVIKIKDGETLRIDGIALNALYTPGHTDDSYSFVTADRVFTGDTLLIRGTGRTDFQNGDPYAHYDSLFNKLLKLPEETLIYPAHDYKGWTVSTIGEEKRNNPRLQVKSADEYAEIMNNLNLPYPTQMDSAVSRNRKAA